jgi:hypothetical protein
MMQRQLSEPPVPLHERREDLPPWCEAVLERALAKSPADRFQTAGEFREALARATGKAGAEAVSPHPAVNGATKVSNHFARTASIVMVVAAFLTVGGYVARRGATAMMSATALPPVVFDAKVLVGGPTAAREREARLVLGDGTITVTATGDAGPPLHSVAYDGVTSISHSRGRDPMWSSPDGPSRVVRAGNGVLGRWGIFVERNWISLRIDGDDEFVVLRVSDEQVENVLTALEKRTGLTADRIGGAN